MIDFNNVKEILNDSLEKNRNRRAFCLKSKANGTILYNDISYQQFYDDVAALGTVLLSKGFTDSKVAIIGKNSYQWIVTYFAVLASGNVLVPLDSGLVPGELRNNLSVANVDCGFYDPDYETIFSDFKNISLKANTRNQFEDLIAEGKALRAKGNDSFERVEIDKDKMSVLIFTSGTTSSSKAVMLSQRNLASNTFGLIAHERLYPDDVYACILPLHHAFGAQAVIMFISVGMTIVFAEGLRIDKCLNEYKVSVFVGVPLILNAVYRKIQTAIDRQGKRKSFERALKLSKAMGKVNIDLRRKLFKSVIDQLGGSLWFMINGASGVDPKVEEFFNDIGILTVNGYGLTEMSPVVASESYKYLKYGSIGKTLPNVEYKIDSPDENGIGELLVSGPNTMLGYYNEPELTANVMENGYFKTGDLAYVDKQGYIFITGRKKNVIVLPNGKNVFPEEIEMKIEQFNYVKDCMVYGTDSICVKIVYDEEVFGEGVDVYSVVKYDIDKLNEKLTAYKRIAHIDITTEPMDKTTTGKIKRYKEIEKIKENKDN